MGDFSQETNTNGGSSAARQQANIDNLGSGAENDAVLAAKDAGNTLVSGSGDSTNNTDGGVAGENDLNC